jgi:two-component sensor histidine kinase
MYHLKFLSSELSLIKRTEILFVTILLCLFSNQISAQNFSKSVGTDSIFNWYFGKAEKAILNKDFLLAESFLDSANFLAVSLGDEYKEARAKKRLGYVKRTIGDYELSLSYLKSALSLFEKQQNIEEIVSCHVDLAELSRKFTKYDLARNHIKTAQMVYDEGNLTDTLLLIKIISRSAAINNESNPDITASIKESYKSIRLAQLIGADYYLATSLNELGYSYKNLTKVELSDSCYQAAEKIWWQNEYYYEALFTMNNRAMMYLHNGFKKEEIIPTYRRIDQLNDSLNVNFDVRDPFYRLFDHYIQEGDSAMALYYYMKGHQVDLKNSFRNNDYNFHNMISKHENEQIKKEYEKIETKLNASKDALIASQRESKFQILAISILLILILGISILFYLIRRSNRKLKERNKEKDSLIQEIHHRVKNNLQFISSLLNMQMKTTEKADESKSLTEASRRINAMALVHEMLYNRAEEKGIAVKYYLEELTDSLNTLVNSDHKQIEFEQNIIDVNLDVSDTISIGMITSELVSNSMKHAFQNTENPKVSLYLNQINTNEFEYIIKDNGKGFTEDKKSENKLGLRLVDIFSRQLKGSYTIDGSNGFRYTLTFHKKK